MSVHACCKYVESIWKKYFEWSIWTNTSTDKKCLKYQNAKYSICSISNTKYQIQKVFQILPTSLKACQWGLDLFVKLKYESSTILLFVGIRYSMRDLLSDLNNYAWTANWRYASDTVNDIIASCGISSP